MTAQYKPYRDEESVDGLETASWTDHEPGSIQIYEKTTEELPFNSVNKRPLWIQSALCVTTLILGFLIGFFMHFHSNDHPESSSLSRSPMLATLFNEDSTIKDKLLDQIDGNKILQVMYSFKDVTRTPGSDGDKNFASHVHDEFVSNGFDSVTAHNYTFATMLPEKPSVVRILDKNNATIYSTDSEHLTPFLPLSQADELDYITDELIYVNKGSKEDYLKLTALGFNVSTIEGKVFVIRQSYYQAHDVIINAQEGGAKAIILFPDPDVFGSNSPFPPSMRLPNDAVKAHPLAWSNYGDLVSLNLSSLAGVDVVRLGLDKESKVQTPVLLLSFDAAKKLLMGLSGPTAPQDWNCFDFTLHIGPGYKEDNGFDERNKVHLEFYNQGTRISTSTITGVIAGSLEPDRYVVIGSRRDSLNQGVLDSVSGTAVMLEIARVFGGLVKQGWRPKRTIVFNSFGAESLNLIGSSHWLEANQRLLSSRAVAYINCDLVVTGNQTVTIAASPLLYQVLYNATRQVSSPDNQYENIYLNWRANQIRSLIKMHDTADLNDMQEFLWTIKDIETHLDKETKAALEADTSSKNENLDLASARGNILQEYKKSASNMLRPKVRQLDLQSIYSPFFIYTGVPVVDVRYSGFHDVVNKTNLIYDTLPLLGTKYDNMNTVQHIDPHLKYHVAIAQVLSEILRDLSDSVYLPFNLLDYAITLRENYAKLMRNYGKVFQESKIDLDSLKQVIDEFTVAAVKFHYHQDRLDAADPHQIRRLNDQMMLLERAFLDPSGLPNYWDRKHLILAPNDGQDHRGFPGLVDWLSVFEGEGLVENFEKVIFVEVLKVHYKAVLYTIQSAIKIIDEVHII